MKQMTKRLVSGSRFAVRTALAIALSSIAFQLSHAHGQQESEPQEENKQLQSAEKAVEKKAPLTVRIRPLDRLQTEPLTPEQLRDAPVILEDGTIISFGDWVLGALRRGDVDSTSSDLDQKLFLGKVARAIAGAEAPLNEGQPIQVGENLPGAIPETFVPNDLSDGVAALQTVVCLVLCYQAEETSGPYDATPSASKSVSKSSMIGGAGTDSPLFQNQVARDLSWSYGDWKRRQFIREAVKQALKEVAEDP